jgi:hypothetical protein
MSRADVLSFGTSRSLAKDEWGSIGNLATTNWLKISTSSRRLLVAASLFAAYAPFGTIVWATYLALESSPRRVVSMAPEPATPQTLVLENAWHRWLRHQAAFKKRIEAMTRAQSSRRSETLPADRSGLSSRASSPAPAHQPTTSPLMPSFKPVDAYALHALAAMAPVPSLKPARPLQQARYLPAMERTREEGEPAFFRSRHATPSAPSSADPIEQSAGRWQNDRRDSPGREGLADRDRSRQRSAAGSDSSGEAGTGGASERAGGGEGGSGDPGDTQDRSARGSGGAERDHGIDDDRTSAGRDAGRGNTRDGRASSSNANRGRNSARSDRNRGRGNDRGVGNDRGRGRDRGRGARGGRGGRGDRSGRGRGRR